MSDPYYVAERVALYLGDCIEVMRALPDASVDAIVTDPPYELGFMGKHWDGTGIAYSVEMWAEALRVLKPGGYLAAFGGTRTYHRMACAIEDAGFEVRDCLAWMYGSGFPKSLDVSKAIDRANGDERPVVGVGRTGAAYTTHDDSGFNGGQKEIMLTSAASAAWDGWGTALKPAYEPIVLARKPLVGTVAENVLQHGTGAINVDGCRIETDDNLNGGTYSAGGKAAPLPGDTRTGAALGMFAPGSRPEREYVQPSGRWPANVLMDEEAAAILDAQVGYQRTGRVASHSDEGMWGSGADIDYADSERGGGPSRFFYTAKASRSEREAGVQVEHARRSDGRHSDIENPRLRTNVRRNDHPTVKPVDLMRWLCRLVTPPGGVVLDCFNGSGTTGMAALDEGFSYIGIEREARYIEIAKHRITHRHVIEVVTAEPDEESPQGRLL